MIGIYTITNTVTGQRYVGLASNVRARLTEHRGALRAQRHCNRYLQASFDKYGEAAFVMGLVLACRKLDLALYETLAVRAFNSTDLRFGFNLQAPGEGTFTHAPETCAAIAEFNRGRTPYVRTPEIRARIANTLRGQPSPKKGKPMSAEQRAKLAQAKRLNWADPKYRAMMLERNHSPGCKRLSPETTTKIADSMRRAYAEGRAVSPFATRAKAGKNPCLSIF